MENSKQVEKEHRWGPLQSINNTFNKSIIKDFKKYIKPLNDSGVNKWTIYSDYCLEDKNKLYSAMTFTLVPYIDHFEELKKVLKEIAPNDLKKTKLIDKRFCSFLKSGYVFNFSFIFEKGENHFFCKLSREEFIKAADELIKMYQKWIITTPINTDYFNRVITKVKKLKQEMQRKTFNVTLFQNIWIVQLLVSYIMMIVTRESSLEPEIIGWFSDRDKIVHAYDEIIIDLANATYHNICELENVGDRECRKIVYPSKSQDSKALWFDEFIRIPDYLSGALAGRNYENKLKDKYDILFEEGIAENPFISTIAFEIRNNLPHTFSLNFGLKGQGV